MELSNRPIHLKSLAEIIAKAQEVIARHRRRFLKTATRPCPINCAMADVRGSRVMGCEGCGSKNPQQCKKDEVFKPLYTKAELYQQFQDILRDPETLWREYRDIFVFFWVLGAFDPIGESGNLDEHIIRRVEKKDVDNSTATSAGRVDGERPQSGPSGESSLHASERAK